MCRADVHALRRSARAYAFHVSRLALIIDATGRNAADEFVPVLDIEHEQAVTAKFKIITNSRDSDVQVAMHGSRVVSPGAIRETASGNQRRDQYERQMASLQNK